MKTLKILFILFIMLGFTLPAKSQGKQVERPMKGSFYATVIDDSNPLLEKLSISGNATHTGSFTGTMYFDKSKIVLDGHVLKNARTFGTIEAANGDCIYFESYPLMILTGPGRSGLLSGKATFKGGTGRFTDCKGEIEQTGVFNMDNDYAMWTADGWIKY